MSLAEPLEVPETEVVMLTLQSMQSQITATQTLIAFLRGRRAESDYALVEEQLQKADAHLQEAVNSMRSMTMPRTIEIFPNASLGSRPHQQQKGRSDRSQVPQSRFVKEGIS